MRNEGRTPGSTNIPQVMVATEEYTFQQPDKYLRNPMKTPLDSGDYAWLGANGALPGLERKRVSELVTLFRGGRRHVEQLARCRRDFTHVYLLLEGEMRESKRDGVLEVPVTTGGRYEWRATTPQVMWGELVEHLETLEWQMGVVIRQTRNYAETCALIERLAMWWQTPMDKHKSAVITPGRDRPFSLVEPGLVDRVAAQLPGVGAVLSGAIAAKARTPHDLDMWTLNDWLAIEKIGKVKAQKIMEAWHGKQ